MNNDDSNKPEQDHHTCNCPYCGIENSVATEKIFIYSYPLKFRSYGIFHGIFLWNNRLPNDVEQTEIVCNNNTCKRTFYLQCWPHNPFQIDQENTGQIKISNEKLFLEDLIDHAHECINNFIYKIFKFRIANESHIDTNDKSLGEMLILNTILVGTMFFFLMLLPAFVTGSLEKLGNDRLIFVTPVLFILLLTSFQRQIGIIHESLLKFNSLPVLLHKKYPKWPDYHKFNDALIERFFFGHPCKNKLKKAITPPYTNIEKWTQLSPPPLIFGIVAILVGLIFYHYFMPTGGFTFFNNYIPYGGFTLTEVITAESNPIIYTSGLFNIGYLLFHAPFWFVIGTIVWLSLVTPCFIYTISRNLPLRIDPLKDIGGPEVLGKILLKSNVSIALLAMGFIAYVIRNESILKRDPTFEIFNVFLLSIFSLVIVFGFLLPLYPIHKKMKMSKENEINDLTGKIDYEKIKTGTASLAEVNLNLLRVELINKISSKREWPFNFDTLSKNVFLTLIPLFELYMTIRTIS